MSPLLVASVALIVAWPAASSAIRALLLRRKLRRVSSTEPPNPKRRMMMDDGKLSRLCNLPDDILHSIMGLLPLEEAVRTCILSRRWERLWRSMPCLNFQPLWEHFLEKPNNHQLINFVNGVFTLRDEEFPIQSFHLTYKHRRDNSDAPVLSSWIMSAIKDGGLQNLSLSLYSPTQQYVLPSCIFSSETLVKLDLRLRGSIMLRLLLCSARSTLGGLGSKIRQLYIAIFQYIPAITLGNNI